MTPLPALSDVIRETLTPEVLEQIQQDGYTWSQGTAKAIILNALLLPLTEREQGLREELAEVQAELQTIDSLMARRPALDGRTRYDNIAKAIRVAGQADAALRRAEAAEARVLALTAENATLQREINKQNDEGQALVDERRTLIDQVARLTAEREALQAWLEERAKPNASSDYRFRHLNKDDGVTYTPYRVMLAELKRLAGAPHAPTQEK